MNYFKYAICPVFLFTPQIVKAQTISYDVDRESGTIGSFGGVGLIEMRNARFSEDGQLAVGIGRLNGTQNFSTTWQATPWLETTLRFSDHQDDSDGVDKAIDLKLRLFEEAKYRPAIAIGLQDMLGDGIYGGEYIVASKKISHFDISMGFGFGSLAGRSKLYNITRIFGDGFRERDYDNPGSENFRGGDYFAGEKMGFFWGLEYNTPIEGLTTKVEYSTFDKSSVDRFSDYESKTAFNVGVNYKANNWLEVGAGLHHGNQVGIHLTAKQNLHRPKKLNLADIPEVDAIRIRELKNRALTADDYKDSQDPDIFFDRLDRMGYRISEATMDDGHINLTLAPGEGHFAGKMEVLGAVLMSFQRASLKFPDAVIHASRDEQAGKEAIQSYTESSYYAFEINSDTYQRDNEIIERKIFDMLKSRKLSPVSVKLENNDAIIEKNVGPFIDIPKNIGRTARVLTNHVPDSIERFKVISKERGVPVSDVSVLRKDFENSAEYNGSPEEILANAVIKEPDIEVAGENGFEKFPNFEFGILPDVQTHFGSEKDDHFKGDLNLKIYGRANLTSNIQANVELKQHVIGNLDTIAPSTNPNVAHVRSDIGLYAREGTTSIQRLTLEHISTPAKGLYTRLTAGHLEAMYSGISGEILYRPYGKSLAAGIDLSAVKQRDYDQLFSMRDYETVTGHMNLYYVNEKYDITTKVSFGRYLAKDWGSTFDISRQFNNGIQIGAWATYTNMTDNNFGRGNFDKGIYITVPFDFFWYRQSREKMRFRFRRLGNNGGQKIEPATNLYDMLSPSQPYKLRNTWNNILD